VVDKEAIQLKRKNVRLTQKEIIEKLSKDLMKTGNAKRYTDKSLIKGG